MTPKQKDKLLNDIIRDINSGVYENIKALEAEVGEIVATGADPMVIRGLIKQAFDRYATASVQDLSLKPIAEQQIIGTRTIEDDQIADLLNAQTQDVIQSNISSGADEVLRTVVVGTAAGVAVNEIAKQARARISGHFVTDSNPDVRKAQTLLKRAIITRTLDATQDEIRRAKRVIAERITGINLTNSVRDLASQRVSDAVMQFDGAFMKNQGDRKGVTRWRYDGGIIDTSRDWCQEHEGQEYTEDEIYDLWMSDWTGKEPGDPFVVRGGYNCRHFWVAVEE